MGGEWGCCVCPDGLASYSHCPTSSFSWALVGLIETWPFFLSFLNFSLARKSCFFFKPLPLDPPQLGLSLGPNCHSERVFSRAWNGLGIARANTRGISFFNETASLGRPRRCSSHVLAAIVGGPGIWGNGRWGGERPIPQLPPLHYVNDSFDSWVSAYCSL
ncbi:MAG: hypothetical protein [Avonheates virus SG_61]|uniref:hypothetical protein n=1 Tax=Avonheates virus SG_61 TaxID=2914487 RepID=UPI002481E4FC|nr:MAG: hypothetical protein QKV61_gp1 [Avonheates virus SG_61]UNI72618.1 MAG: hypothetical protein [Avonheates virus SG_61]